MFDLREIVVVGSKIKDLENGDIYTVKEVGSTFVVISNNNNVQSTHTLSSLLKNYDIETDERGYKYIENVSIVCRRRLNLDLDKDVKEYILLQLNMVSKIRLRCKSIA